MKLDILKNIFSKYKVVTNLRATRETLEPYDPFIIQSPFTLLKVYMDNIPQAMQSQLCYSRRKHQDRNK